MKVPSLFAGSAFGHRHDSPSESPTANSETRGDIPDVPARLLERQPLPEPDARQWGFLAVMNPTRGSGRSRIPFADGALAKLMRRFPFPLNPCGDHVIFYVGASGRLALDADLLGNMWLMSRTIGEVEDE